MIRINLRELVPFGPVRWLTADSESEIMMFRIISAERILPSTRSTNFSVVLSHDERPT